MKKSINIKSLIPVLIPLLAAVLVVSTLAISGNVAKKRDENSPTATQTQTQTQVTEAPKVEDSKVSIVAVGDNLIHLTIVNSGKKSNGELNYDMLYENISKYIKNADIAVINQETMLGGSKFEYSNYPCFNTPWEIGDAAINAGFDVFTCATNHAMDVGSAGIEQEQIYFSKHPEAVHIGTYASEEEYNEITYYKKNGITFALLNYTYGTNGISVPSDKPYIVNLLTEEKVTSDITEARKNADVVMVFPHWGTEYSYQTNEQQAKYIQLFSDLGVDIVIGTHPHVLQPVEWVENAETGKKMLVYYSLGNFISHQDKLDRLCGGLAEITVERKAGEIEITNAKLAPVVTFYKRNSNGYNFAVYKLSDYTDELASQQAQSGASKKYFTNLVKEIVSEEFLDLN